MVVPLLYHCSCALTNLTQSLTFLLAAEPEQDFITCGDCQHEFKLCDIVKFIQHKVNGCNKENVDPFNEHNDSGAPEPPEALAIAGDGPSSSSGSSLISNRRTSISAPIANRSTPELRGSVGDKTSPRPSRDLPSTASSSSVDAKTHNDSQYDNDDDDEDDDDISNEEEENEAGDDVRSRSSSRRRKKNRSANHDTDGGQ